MDLIIAIVQSGVNSSDVLASMFTHSTKLKFLSSKHCQVSRWFPSPPQDSRALAPGSFALDLWPLVPGGRMRWGCRLTHLGPGAVCLPVELWVCKYSKSHVAGSYGHVLLPQEVEDFGQAIQNGRLVLGDLDGLRREGGRNMARSCTTTATVPTYPRPAFHLAQSSSNHRGPYTFGQGYQPPIPWRHILKPFFHWLGVVKG